MGRVKILVLGSGAREHAIITSLLSEETHHDIVAAPGNAGIAQYVPVEPALDPLDGAAVSAYVRDNSIDLVVIGPEAPLVAGVADALRSTGATVFGPDRAAARLEGSKSFAKDIMDAAGIPTGRAVRVRSEAELDAALDAFGAPYVVKADGLAAGKGVIVTSDRAAARSHGLSYLDAAGVLVEEFLDGEEVSLFVVSDGTTVVPLSPAQDYKRLLDNDEGPNTGGMGAYSPLPWLPETFVAEVVETIALPAVRELAKRGTPFVGLLYCGLIVTAKGIRVIEFNARFGDPETQVVLPRLVTPLSELLFAAARGSLDSVAAPEFALDTAVTVVLASEGYPDAPVTGRPLVGLSEAAQVPEVTIAHAATTLESESGAVLTSGGRILSVVARGTTFDEAREHAYEAITRIHVDGGHYRTDVAARIPE